MSKKIKSNWEKLKDSIKLEKKLAIKMKDNSKKNDDYIECIEAIEQLTTLVWIESEMEKIEKI